MTGKVAVNAKPARPMTMPGLCVSICLRMVMQAISGVKNLPYVEQTQNTGGTTK